MRIRLFAVSVCLFAGLAAAAPAEAQYGRNAPSSAAPPARRITSKSRRRSGIPTPDIIIASEGLGQPGDDIDFVNTLGILNKKFRQFKIVLRPATKHKFRFEYTPISYSAEAVVPVSFVFNGQRYNVGVPVESDLTWHAYRFGYEWDFFYRDRGFAGVIVEAKYTDINATLVSQAVGATQFTSAKAPIPASASSAAATSSRTSRSPASSRFSSCPTRRWRTKTTPASTTTSTLYGTVNFNDNFGATVGLPLVGLVLQG